MSFVRYANHGGGYIYMLCKRDTFLQCRQDHLADPIRGSSQEQVDAYLKLTCNITFGEILMCGWLAKCASCSWIPLWHVSLSSTLHIIQFLCDKNPIRAPSSISPLFVVRKCIWDCFEANVLEFADTQWMDYQAQRDLNAARWCQADHAPVKVPNKKKYCNAKACKSYPNIG